MTALVYNPTYAARLMTALRKRYASIASVNTADALDLADQFEAAGYEIERLIKERDCVVTHGHEALSECEILRQKLEAEKDAHSETVASFNDSQSTIFQLRQQLEDAGKDADRLIEGLHDISIERDSLLRQLEEKTAELAFTDLSLTAVQLRIAKLEATNSRLDIEDERVLDAIWVLDAALRVAAPVCLAAMEVHRSAESAPCEEYDAACSVLDTVIDAARSAMTSEIFSMLVTQKKNSEEI